VCARAVLFLRRSGKSEVKFSSQLGVRRSHTRTSVASARKVRATYGTRGLRGSLLLSTKALPSEQDRRLPTLEVARYLGPEAHEEEEGGR
jgi:hypothetical protein